MRWLLFPFAMLYALGFWFVRQTYRWGWRRVWRSDAVCVVALGNLSVGGTGKTPHAEAFARRWTDLGLRVALLSRGYGRRLGGLREVRTDSRADEVGDEPLQIKRHLPDLPVWVAERRADGVRAILAAYPNTQIVLLDDALQHWALHSHQKIVLTAYHQPFFTDYPVPMGRLREPRSGYRRMDVIIVTQCPSDLQPTQRHAFLQQLRPLPHQSVFFSTYRYGKAYRLNNSNETIELAGQCLLVVVAIAQTESLRRYLEEQGATLHWQRYPDHHSFTTNDLEHIQQLFGKASPQPTIILTTEKDAQRLDLHQRQLADLPIYVLPIEVEWLL